METIHAITLAVLIIVALIAYAYLKRVKLEDLIVVHENLSEFWIDPATIPGLVLESDTWAGSHVCQSCEEPGVMVSDMAFFNCQNSDCDLYHADQDAEDYAPGLVSLFYQMSRSFETRKRDNGDSFVVVKDDAEEWISDAIREAHGGTLPDDTIYEFCETAADHFAEQDDDADADDLRDTVFEIEGDIYTSDLTSWLHSRPDHVHYLGQVQEEYGATEDGFQLLAMAQAEQKHEIAYALLETVSEVRDDLISDLDDLADDLANAVIDAEEEE